ncbi:MAG TPA: hypothetical protein VI894_01530 [Candidatus Nanoarchaeia archaeon]|nr:hypothetical protein [Candidatus Nanoarchaeia archaeon]
MNKKKIYLALILIAGFIITATPAFLFKHPVVQTDGATHFVNARIFAETGSLNSEIPKYNWIGIAERKLSEYPPLNTILLGFFIKIFGNDMVWLNGLYAAVFLVIGNYFIYLFTRELTENENIALLVTLFSLLNVRAYYTIFSGILPAFVSYCLSFGALYFALKYFRNQKTKDLLFSIILNAAVWFTYLQQGLFLLAMEAALFAGVLMSRKIKLSIPQIKCDFEKFKVKDFKPFFYLIVPSFLIAVLVAVKYMFAAKARTGIITELIYSFLSATSGYQKIWETIIIMDEPIMVTFAFIGILYLLYKQYWKPFSLIAVGSIIVLINTIIIPENLWVKIYFNRFYLMFFIIMAISASIMLYNFSKNKNIGKVVSAIIIISLLLQAGKLAVFYYKIGPALDSEEYASAMFLNERRNSSILYIQNEDVSASFRDFKWIVVYAETNNYDFVPVNYLGKLENPEGYDYVYIYNKNFLKQEDKNALKKLNIAFEGKHVEIYEVTK